MSLTRAQLRTRCQRVMDAVASTRWDTTAGATGEIDQVLGLVHMQEWKRILNVNRHYRVNKVQPTSDSDGRIAISSLTTGSADSVKNFYRVLLFARANYPYKTGTVEEWALGETNGVSPRVWYLEGTNIMFLPKEVSTALTGASDGIWVNYYPCLVDRLSSDSVTVDFPDGYEGIIAYEAAAILLAKGGAEFDTTQRLKVLAEEMREAMLQDLARTSAKAMRMSFEDTSAQWGGN